MSFPFPLAPDLVAGKFSHSGPLDGPVPLPLLVDDSGPSYPCDTAEAKVGAMATWRAKRGVRAREGARSQAHQGSQTKKSPTAERASRPDDSTISWNHERRRSQPRSHAAMLPSTPHVLRTPYTVLGKCPRRRLRAAGLGPCAAWTGETNSGYIVLTTT